jgi:prevent-host-death family protein
VNTLEITAVSPGLAQAVETMKGEPLVLTKGGRPVAVLLPAAGADLQTVALSLSPQFRAILEESARRQQAEGGISPHEMRRRLGVEAPAAPGGGRKVRSKRP